MHLGEFRPALLKQAFYHYLQYTDIDSGEAKALLAELVQKQVVSYRDAAKILMRNFGGNRGAFPWTAEALQQINTTFLHKHPPGEVVALAIYGLYQLWQRRDYYTETLGCREFAVDVHFDCPLHAQDRWKVVEATTYWAEKPMREVLYCRCWADWAPTSPRVHKRWLASIERSRQEVLDTTHIDTPPPNR